MVASGDTDMAIQPQAPFEASSHPDVPSQNDIEEATSLSEKKHAKGDVEAASVEEGEKVHYSKKSVWLMILFSGLAIGSDG